MLQKTDPAEMTPNQVAQAAHYILGKERAVTFHFDQNRLTVCENPHNREAVNPNECRDVMIFARESGENGGGLLLTSFRFRGEFTTTTVFAFDRNGDYRSSVVSSSGGRDGVQHREGLKQEAYILINKCVSARLAAESRQYESEKVKDRRMWAGEEFSEASFPERIGGGDWRSQL